MVVMVVNWAWMIVMVVVVPSEGWRCDCHEGKERDNDLNFQLLHFVFLLRFCATSFDEEIIMLKYVAMLKELWNFYDFEISL